MRIIGRIDDAHVMGFELRQDCIHIVDEDADMLQAQYGFVWVPSARNGRHGKSKQFQARLTKLQVGDPESTLVFEVELAQQREAQDPLVKVERFLHVRHSQSDVLEGEFAIGSPSCDPIKITPSRCPRWTVRSPGAVLR